MSDVGPEQLGIDFSAVPIDRLEGGIPADPVVLDDAIAAFFGSFLAALPEPPSCLPDRGVHIYADHRGAGPCLCKTKTRPSKGAT